MEKRNLLASYFTYRSFLRSLRHLQTSSAYSGTNADPFSHSFEFALYESKNTFQCSDRRELNIPQSISKSLKRCCDSRIFLYRTYRGTYLISNRPVSTAEGPCLVAFWMF